MFDKYEVRELTEDQFAAFEEQWQNCLQQSSADPVFSSWAWCISWWNTWSEIYGLKLRTLLVFADSQLIGIAPLYQVNTKRKYGPSGPQLQFLGNAWRVGPTVRSEYTGFIIKNDHYRAVLKIIGQFLKSTGAHDLIIQDHLQKLKVDYRALGLKTTDRANDRGVSFNVTGTFQDWIKSIGKNTRLKVYNRRNYLKGRIEIIEVPYSEKTARNDFFNLLCKFHLKRRQIQPTEQELNFHINLAKNAGPCIEPIYSILKVDDQVISLVYDVKSKDRRYNLQCVFIEDFDRKVSPGLLHLGYVIEDAFEDKNTKIYDLLAGKGKNTFYKERLIGNAGDIYEFVSTQISLTYSHVVYISLHMFIRNIIGIFSNTGK